MPDPSEPYPYLKNKDEANPEMKVAPKVFTRLKLAADAIAATKVAIEFQGNQIPALRATKMNSEKRLQVMRDYSCWEMTPEARKLGSANPEALIAAKADIAHGGNCGEHAWVAYHYLREHATGEPIQVSQQDGFDHAFVLIGNIVTEPDEQIVVSDPWVNAPMACLWPHHFAFCPRDKILDHQSSIADGKSFKEAIKAGLKLSAYGLEMVAKAETEQETERLLGAPDAHFWDHDEARTEFFDYQGDAGVQMKLTPEASGQ